MIINFIITVLFIIFMLWVGYWFLDWHLMDKTTRMGKIVAELENFFNHLFHKHRVDIRYKNIFLKLYILFDRLVVLMLNYNYMIGIKKLPKRIVSACKWLIGKVNKNVERFN